MTPHAKDLLATAVAQQQGDVFYCALSRLNTYSGSSKSRLTEVAQDIGFTLHEAYGIMDGWDCATQASRALFVSDRSVSPEEYDEGYRLGKSLAEATFKLDR